MRDQRAVRESIVNNQADGNYLWIENSLPISNNTVCLCNFYKGNIIYFHSNAFGYNKCKFDSIPETALMVKSKSINGDISHAC